MFSLHFQWVFKNMFKYSTLIHQAMKKKINQELRWSTSNNRGDFSLK